MDLATTFLKPSRGALCVGVFLTLASPAARADERCQQLVALNQQYIGVALTGDQKQLKHQLVAWYKANADFSHY
jgi:hypothetical protein